MLGNAWCLAEEKKDEIDEERKRGDAFPTQRQRRRRLRRKTAKKQPLALLYEIINMMSTL